MPIPGQGSAAAGNGKCSRGGAGQCQTDPRTLREQSGKNVKPQHTEVSGRHDSGLLYLSFLYSANKPERLQVWREELWLTRCD